MARDGRSFIMALSLAVTGCGGGGGAGGAPVTVATADLSASRLQFSIGTATFPGSDEQPISGPILNLVETFRQPNGTSALLNDSVTITGPASFVVASVANPGAVVNDGGAPNQLIDTLANVSAFGESFGVNVNGIAQAPAFTTGFAIAPGGPPAFPRTTDGNYPAGFSYGANIVAIGGSLQNYPKGFPLGTYTLKVSTPPGSGQAYAWTAAATLATRTALPAIAAPALSFDGLGGGSVTFVVPSKITEVFVSISAVNDQCWPNATHTSDLTGVQTSSGVFSLFVKSPRPGALTLAIPDNLGPPASSADAPTFCSAAQNALAYPAGAAGGGGEATVQIVGVDYPLYEMSYPQSTAQTPAIAGAIVSDGKASQSDVTVSAATSATAP